MKIEKILAIPAIVIGVALLYFAGELDYTYKALYFILGLIITLLSFSLLVLELPKKKPEKARQPQQDSHSEQNIHKVLDKCPNCGAAIVSAGKFCGNCGKSV